MGHRGVVAVCMLAAELGTGVDGDGRDFGDAFLPVIRDPEKRIAPDLDPAWIWHLAGPIEEYHHRDARGVVDILEDLPRLLWQRDVTVVHKRQRGGRGEYEGVGGVDGASGDNLPAPFAPP